MIVEQLLDPEVAPRMNVKRAIYPPIDDYVNLVTVYTADDAENG